MAAPVEEEFPFFAYTCCDVWAMAPLGDPCWSCGQQTHKLNCDDLELFDKLQRPRHMVSQNTDNSYL